MGVDINTTNTLEVFGSVVEGEIGSFQAYSPLHSDASYPVLGVITSSRTICLLSCSRGTLVPSGIQETPRVASHNGSQEGSCILVNLPLSSLDLHFVPSGIFCFVLDKGEGEGGKTGKENICLLDILTSLALTLGSCLETYWEQGSLMFSRLEGCPLNSALLPRLHGSFSKAELMRAVIGESCYGVGNNKRMAERWGT